MCSLPLTPSLCSSRQELLSGLMEWLVATGDVTPAHTDPRGAPRYPHPASSCATGGADGPRLDNGGLDDQRHHNDLLKANGVTGFYRDVDSNSRN